MADTDSPYDRRQVRRAFDHAASTYDAAAVLQRHVAAELDQRLDELGLAPTRVLDLGSGTGELTRRLRARYPAADLVALDIAPTMAARSAEVLPGAALCADAERLPLADASFDLVVSSLAVQWCDHRRVFESVRAALSPGGLWMFSSVGPDTLMELRNAWRVAGGDARVHDFVDMHHLGDALLSLGFSDPVLDVDRVNIAYADVAGLLRDLKALGVVNARSDRPRGLLGRRRLAALAQAYEVYRDEAGDLPSTWEVVYAHAHAPNPGSVNVQFDPGRMAGGS